jgi:hypothetical protein
MMSIAGTEDGTEDGIKDGRMYLDFAADLWSLVSPRRGAAIRTWLHDEWAAHDDDPVIEVYDVGSLRRLVGLLEGLADALRAELTDADFRIDAATAERIQARHPLLVDSWQEPGGRVYTLSNRLGEVGHVERLVKRAVEQGRALEVG